MQRCGTPAKRLHVPEPSPTQQFVETVSLYFANAQKTWDSPSLTYHTLIEVYALGKVRKNGAEQTPHQRQASRSSGRH
jgi:hypothetical protein